VWGIQLHLDDNAHYFSRKAVPTEYFALASQVRRFF